MILVNFFGIFNMFFTCRVHDLRAIIRLVGGRNEKKLNGQFFFLVGSYSSSSEDSSTVEYSEHALKSLWRVHVGQYLLHRELVGDVGAVGAMGAAFKCPLSLVNAYSVCSHS